MSDKNSPLILGTEPIGKLLTQYAIPAIIAMTASSLYNMADSIFIGHGVGAMGIAGLLDYDSLARSMPAILALSQFIGCVICGVIVSAIVPATTRKSDFSPFGNNGSQSDNTKEEE